MSELSDGRGEDLAGIEYVGLAGIPKESQDAVLRYIQYGDKITRVRILSSARDHCLLLDVDGDVVAVKSGFGSGYWGGGPGALSYVLAALEAHGAKIVEYAVGAELLERLDRSALTRADLQSLDDLRPLHARRWMDYIFNEDRDPGPGEKFLVWRHFPAVIPFAIIDARITDLALAFWDQPDQRLLTGYRRLEDIVRERTGINDHGQKLFSKAFAEGTGPLCWNNVDGGEHAGRLSVFTGTYMAFRNRRAHRETTDQSENSLSEFLLLNQLFRLEGEAQNRVAEQSAEQA